MTAAICLIRFLKPIKNPFLMYFSEMYSIFFSRWLLSYFIPLRKVGDLYAPPCILLIENIVVLWLCVIHNKICCWINTTGMTHLKVTHTQIQCVPLATEPGISLIILPLMRILQRLQTHATDTFLFISHTTNALLFKFRCNIFIGVRIIKEMSGSIASGTHCIMILLNHI